ncbi:MAG: PilT/PilU family type 4a pilus ATPase [bacterium]
MPSADSITIQKILATAAEYGASDIHLIPGNPPILRVDGKLAPLESEAMITPDVMEALEELMLNPDQQNELAKNKELITATSLENHSRFKVSFFYQKGLLSASLRMIPLQLRNLKELGLPAIVEKFADLSKGLVLITGPFGSGRTATLAALISEINRRRAVHIITIEQPIEHIFVNEKSIIEQREVGRDTNSYEQALTTASREDVDVIMVSEMDSAAVVRSIMTVTETNRLVLSTMNTDSVMKTIEKIIDSYPVEEEEQVRRSIAENLQGIVSQRLLPRVGGGRIIVAEIMIPNDAVRSVIREGQIFQLNSILQTSREEGMISLDRYLAELVRTGEILMDDAMVHAVDRRHVSVMLRQ